VLGSTVAK